MGVLERREMRDSEELFLRDSKEHAQNTIKAVSAIALARVCSDCPARGTRSPHIRAKTIKVRVMTDELFLGRLSTTQAY